MKKIRRIMHPTDFSGASSAAFRRAVDLAKTNGAELLLVHVITSVVPIMTDGYVSPRVYEDLEAAARTGAQKQLDKLVRKARQAGARVKGLLLEGVPHERIAQAARSKKADMVVMGTHGRTGFAKLVLGSVASRVLTAAPCPVLTVRGT
ncbi:MAG TPA: universal stress protein [Methylomirabilota bacterium]|jgi:nucleotide-binding universal stress UspA family protein